MQMTKDVVVSDKTFRLRRIEAQMGAWILSVFLETKIPTTFADVSKLVGSDDPTTPIGIGRTMTRSEFFEIQRACLELVLAVRTTDSGQELLEPVMMAGGVLVAPYQYDVVLIQRLATEVLNFTVLEPFFTDAALQMKKAAPDPATTLSLTPA